MLLLFITTSSSSSAAVNTQNSSSIQSWAISLQIQFNDEIILVVQWRSCYSASQSLIENAACALQSKRRSFLRVQTYFDSVFFFIDNQLKILTTISRHQNGNNLKGNTELKIQCNYGRKCFCRLFSLIHC